MNISGTTEPISFMQPFMPWIVIIVFVALIAMWLLSNTGKKEKK